MRTLLKKLENYFKNILASILTKKRSAALPGMIHEAAIHVLSSFQLVQLLHKAVVTEDGPV
jgi:hypothetical protein